MSEFKLANKIFEALFDEDDLKEMRQRGFIAQEEGFKLSSVTAIQLELEDSGVAADGWTYINNENPVMPEVHQRVFVTTSNGIVKEMTYKSNIYAATEKGRIPRFELEGKISPWLVIAWQQLPKPAKI